MSIAIAVSTTACPLCPSDLTRRRVLALQIVTSMEDRRNLTNGSTPPQEDVGAFTLLAVAQSSYQLL